MASQICFKCFRVKGDYEVCPHCGYAENTRAEQAYQLNPGTVLRGRYIIGTCIGFGGFGITYRSYDSVLGVVVAIKEFYPAGLVSRAAGEIQIGIFSGDKEAEFERQKARFLEEARNMAIFSQEKDIVNVFDFFEENHTAYIIMEYIEGELLKTRLQKDRMPVPEATDYMLALLDALQKVHRNGIIHRDISPDNIFLTGEKSIKLFDFGAAKFQGTESERSDAAVVKAGYTPPEQYRSMNEQGAFMDVYAAGAVFYHMVTGEKPLEAPDRGMEDELQMPSELGVEIDPNLERIIMKAMALKSEQRFQTAEQFRDAILSGKRVKMPEESGIGKKWMIAAGAMGIAAVGLIAAAVIHTSIVNRGKINVDQISEETVDVWLCLPDMEESAGTEAGSGSATDLEGQILDVLQKSISDEYPQITIQAECFSPQEYGQKIVDAAQAGQLPDVFCTDYLDAAEVCCDLGLLLNTLDTSDYYFWDSMADSSKGIRELPSALQIAVCYQNEEKCPGQEQEAVEIASLDGKENRMYTDEENAFTEFSSSESETELLLGNLADLTEVKASTVDQLPPIGFGIYPVLSEGKFIGNYQYCYGVNQLSSQNKQQAGMLVIAMLVSDSMQSEIFMDNEAGIPLNKDTYKKYQEYKLTSYLSFLKDCDLKTIEVEEGRNTQSILKTILGDSE